MATAIWSAPIRRPKPTATRRTDLAYGLGLFPHERPIISRLVSMEQPMEIKEGMVIALKTYCPASDGHSRARIEEAVVMTHDGCRIITLFPSEELPVANAYWGGEMAALMNVARAKGAANSRTGL